MLCEAGGQRGQSLRACPLTRPPGVPDRFLAWGEHEEEKLERDGRIEPLGRFERGAAHDLSPPGGRFAGGRPFAPSRSHHRAQSAERRELRRGCRMQNLERRDLEYRTENAEI